MFRADFSGIRGSAAEAVVDGFPLGRRGREVDGDPVVIPDVGLVETALAVRAGNRDDRSRRAASEIRGDGY